jgi:tetratricopeptide (TPR) repeat protein
MIEYRLGRIADARAALDAAVAGFGTKHGRNHPIALQLLNADGVLALGAGDWPRAITSFAELAARKQALFGPEHLDVSDALANLGAAQYQAGEFEPARLSQTRALEIRERELGPGNLWVGHSLANLALAHARLGRADEAEQAARRALAIIIEVRGADHHDAMLSHALLGEVLHAAGDDERALAAFAAAAELAERHGSPLQRAELHLQTALALLHLQRLEQASEQLDLVEPFVTTEQSFAGLTLLYEYARGRIAEQRDDPALAQRHRSNAAAALTRGALGSMLALAEARAWLE